MAAVQQEREGGRVRRSVKQYLPILGWLPSYRRNWFIVDAVAAISVWALLVPQSLGYATLAGVPVQYGLYTAFAALVAYAIFGTSKQVVQGPSGSVAAVSAAVVAPLVGMAAMGSEDAVPMTAALAITTGVVYLALGIAKAGWISNFLSRAVMSGFVLGFSIGIIIDQSYKLLGVDKTSGSYWDELVGTIGQVADTNLYTLAVGVSALVVLLLMRRFVPRWPRALIVVALSIVAVNVFDLTSEGVAVTGDIPTGLFTVGVPQDVWGEVGALIAGALSIIFVGYSETLASGRAMASKHGDRLDTNQELVAEGFACGAAGLVGGFVTDGSLSKTSVADAAGQKSQMASLINAVFVLLTILFLASLFKNLPAAVLGAVVIDAMVGLIDFRPMVRYFRVSRSDWLCYMAAGLGILFFSIIQGIVIGVVLSLLLLIAHASRPALRRMGKQPESDTYVDAARHESAIVEPSVLVVRLDGPLFFADANVFHDGVNQLISAADAPVHAVVLDMEAVSHTDTDGADTLTSMASEMKARGIWFGIARAEEAILVRWDRAGAIEAIGRNHVFGSVQEAAHEAGARAGVDPSP